MYTMIKRLGYGVVVWAVPYVTALPLLPLAQRDPIFFGTIMIVEGSVVGTILALAYFDGVTGRYVTEGLVLGAVWMVENWALDFVGILTFNHMAVSRYFMEVGLRYVPMIAVTTAIGYALSKGISAGPRKPALRA
jgi:hypothetical protein